MNELLEIKTWNEKYSVVFKKTHQAKLPTKEELHIIQRFLGRALDKLRNILK